jgi:hypothetical protein
MVSIGWSRGGLDSGGEDSHEILDKSLNAGVVNSGRHVGYDQVL